jgi:2,3-bisphosphoglycerate-independent phosphoglycerate mutase
MDTIASTHSHRALAAHGLSVGLSDGLMGNSEVGHLNIGAGRVVWQDIVKIDVSIKKGAFHKNETILESMGRAKEGNGRLHFLGLVSESSDLSHTSSIISQISTLPQTRKITYSSF